MVNFPTRIPNCDSHSPALLDLFLSSDASICSTMAFLLLGNSDHVAVSVSIDFTSNSKRDVSFHYFACLVLIATDFVIIWDIFDEEISLKSMLLLLLMKFVSELSLRSMYIFLIVSIRSSLTCLHGYQLLLLLP